MGKTGQDGHPDLSQKLGRVRIRRPDLSQISGRVRIGHLDTARISGWVGFPSLIPIPISQKIGEAYPISTQNLGSNDQQK